VSEFEEKLNAILSDPNALSQVASLAQSLNLGGSTQEPKEPPPAPEKPKETPSGNSSQALSGLGELLGDESVGRLLPLLGELTSQSGNDDRLALLTALRPFLKPERQEKLDRAVKTARLVHVGKKLLTELSK
jgi:hypothetical protein